MLKYSSTAAASALGRRSGYWRPDYRYVCHYQKTTHVCQPRIVGSALRRHMFTCTQPKDTKGVESAKDHSERSNGDRSASELEKLLMRGYSPYLTKFHQLLPSGDQKSLQMFSDTLSNKSATGRSIYSLYKTLRKSGLHKYLTIRAIQHMMTRVASDSNMPASNTNDLASSIVMQLIDDYTSLGFVPSTEEYSGLVRALAQEAGREHEALQLLDDLVDSSDIAPFLASLKRRRSKPVPKPAMIPSEEEIARIEKSLLVEEQKRRAPANINHEGTYSAWLSSAASEATGDLDRIQKLVAEERQRRRSENERHGARDKTLSLPVSRNLYHMAMRGFAQIYHVRGVMEILNRMLEAATQVPFRIARHLMPNKETWDIVGEVLVRQRDRPTFVRTWIEFLSRGARPPNSLTQSLIRMLVRQSCVEQAVWAMRISRCLPDHGEKLPKSPHAKDHVPWDLKVQIMYVSSALEAATSLDATAISREDALRQGKYAAQLPLLEKPDPAMYAQLIGGAVRVKNEKLAEHLFKELVDAGVAPDNATYGHLASLYADKGQIKRVFLIARDMLVHRHSLLAQEKVQRGLLRSPVAQAKFKEWARRQASSLKADVECIAPLLQYYIQENREQEALMLLRGWDHIYEKRVPVDKFANALLKVYNRPEDTATIERLTKRLLIESDDSRSSRRDGQKQEQSDDTAGAEDVQAASRTEAESMLRAFSQMIQTHLRAKNLPGVVRALREMAALNLQPSYSILELVMRGFLREQALDLFDTVHAYLRETLKMPLSLPLYSLWMRSLVNHGDVVGVQAAFDELLEMGQFPTQQHYLLLVQAYAYNGWIERAASIVNNLRNPHSVIRPGLNLNIAIIEAHVACGNMEQAEAELRYLLDNTLLPANRIPARPFNYMIIGSLYYGDGRKAMQMYEHMIRLGVKPDVYTFSILMHSYALAKDLGNCTRVFNEMIRVGIAPDLVIYTILICAFGIAKKVGSAELVFNQVAQEQEWAQVQHKSHENNSSQIAQDNIQITSPDSLDIYAEDPNRQDWPELLNTVELGENTQMERLRTSSFVNLDPIVYIAMLKVYSKAHRPMRALATWDRLIKNFPVVHWNAREGGILSKTLSYTAQFHLPAWTLLLRTAKVSIGAQRAMEKKSTLSRYFFMPLYPTEITDALNRRRQQKQQLAQQLEATSPKNKNDTAVHAFSARMIRRAELVACLENELDRRAYTDFEFCVKQRYEAPRLTAAKWDSPFVDFGYWVPDGAKNLAKDELLESDNTVDNDNTKSYINSDGNFTQETAQGIASIVARQWHDLEVAGFKFNNIHVSDYLPCMLVGRQYSDLRRFLSLVEPLGATNTITAHGNNGFRYRNISIHRRLTNLLLRQISVVRRLLLIERDRRVLIDALLNVDTAIHGEYANSSKVGDVKQQRAADEIQVMKERRAVHAEREISWASELGELGEVAKLWQRLVGSEEQEMLEHILNEINRVL
ncbi:hypothetical protein GQ54DRAFT_34407 [Martensiomyces pterosporus]|nr:hypothetical protein GQ54DRAFT_34407 [Martensiomyces pterosporus]